MGLRSKVASWFVPSRWIDWLAGRKRILGGLSLFLYVIMYVLPTLYPDFGWLAGLGAQLRGVLEAAGLQLSDELLIGGSGLTVVGLVDWALDYGPTKVTSTALKKIEKPFVPEPDSDGGLHAP